jgi:hypothetical protein
MLALPDPAMGGPALVLRMHRIGEVDGLVGGDTGEEPLVGGDESLLRGDIGAGGQPLGLRYSKPSRCSSLVVPAKMKGSGEAA